MRASLFYLIANQCASRELEAAAEMDDEDDQDFKDDADMAEDDDLDEEVSSRALLLAVDMQPLCAGGRGEAQEESRTRKGDKERALFWVSVRFVTSLIRAVAVARRRMMLLSK